MSESPRGLPLLSGPPPEPPLNDRGEMSCRKCDKEFNILFARGRRCNHCGYSYCNSCSDYQALMPRRGSDDTGYDCMPVCAFCIQYLQITAGGKSFLRSLPVAKLRNYMQAYGLRLGADVLEKDDIINAIIAARTENGCLPKANENYYRKYSVPTGQTSRPRGLFSRQDRTQQPRQYLDPRAGWAQPLNFARPDLQSDNVNTNPSAQYAPPPGPPPYATYSATSTQPPPRQNSNPNLNPNAASSNPYIPNNYSYTQPHAHAQPSFPYPPYQQYQRPTARPATAPPRPPPPQPPPQPQRAPHHPLHQTSQPQPKPRSPPRPHVPTLDELLQMPETSFSSLSIGVLKEILEQNHVRLGPVLEKSELVARVEVLVRDERKERVHAEAVREREAWEEQERAWTARQRERREKEEKEEEERRRRREAYRTTVESASESEESLPPGSGSGSGSGQPSSMASMLDLGQTRQESPSSANAETERRDGDENAMSVDTDPVDPLSRTSLGGHKGSPSPPLTRTRSATERSGLCVVCQDEDANIVIIDCGHLALCRACSDLVWSSTRECPLCRTRIVTQARFLRVFKS